jgi:WD40 repeat protein
MTYRSLAMSNESPPPEGYRYWAFISYSHADKKIVNWLHSSIEQYRLPKGVTDGQQQPIARQIFPVFRDRDELPSSSDLGQHLHQALVEARYLIVVCSPNSARSKWVNEEIKTFKSLGRSHRVLCLIIDGEPNATDMPGHEHLECFPPAIRFEVAPDRSLLPSRTEAIAADARQGKDGKRMALLKLIAGIVETNFADLVQRQEQRRIKRLIGLASVMSVLVFAFAIITWQAISAKVRVEELYRTALSRQLAHYADAPTNGEQNVATNILLGALQANFIEPTLESNSSMFRSLLRTEKLHTVIHLPAQSAGVSLSPNGQLIASANWDGSVSFIQADNLKILHSPIVAHKEKVLTTAFSRDSRFLISGGVDQAIQIWDAQTAQLIGQKIHAHDGWVTGVAFLADSNRFVSIGWDGVAQLWDTQKRTVIEVLHRGDGPLTTLALSADQRFLAVAGESENIFIVDLQKRSKQILKKMGGGIQSITFSPDGKRLAVAGVDKAINVFEIKNGSAAFPAMIGHEDGVTSIAFSRDGKRLASTSWDKTVRIWDAVNGGQSIHILRGHGAQVTSAVFSADDKFLFSSSLDQSLIVWEPEASHPLIKTKIDHTSEVRRIALSKDGKLLATVAWDGKVFLYQTETQNRLPIEIKLPNVNLYTAAFSPDTKLLAIAGSDKKIYLWDVEAGHFRSQTLNVHQAAILSLDFNPNGSLLASGDWAGSVLLWDMKKSVKLDLPLMTHKGQVTSVIFSPTGKSLASAGDDESIAIWDIEKLSRGDPLDRVLLTGHSGMVTDLSYSHDGKTLASASDDETVMLWDTESHQKKGTILKLGSVVTAVTFDPADKIIATGTVSGIVKLWDVQTGRQFGDPIPNYGDRISNLKFSPDGSWLFWGSYNKSSTILSMDQKVWKARLCQIANRNLSREEWELAIGSYLKYQSVCAFK